MTIFVRRLLFSFKVHNYSGGTLLTQKIYSPQSRKERKERHCDRRVSALTTTCTPTG